MTEQKKNKPIKKYSCKGVTASVWENTQNVDGEEYKYHTVSLQKSYKDKSDEWQTTTSLSVDDLPKAETVLREAYLFLALKESEE